MPGMDDKQENPTSLLDDDRGTATSRWEGRGEVHSRRAGGGGITEKGENEALIFRFHLSDSEQLCRLVPLSTVLVFRVNADMAASFGRVFVEAILGYPNLER
jgi:hypothetical protein